MMIERISERIFLFLPLYKYQIWYEKEVVYEKTSVEEDYKHVADRVYAGGVAPVTQMQQGGSI